MLGDADGYQNGLMVIDEKQYAFFEKNKDREMTWGNREFMWGESTLEESIEVSELSDDEFAVLEKLGLADFGIPWRLEDFFHEMEGEE